MFRGSEAWSRRPTTYPTQTLVDGYPPGAQLPNHIEAWRLAVINDGPEWLDGDRIGLELGGSSMVGATCSNCRRSV